jgi:hypothetical protein
LKNKKVNIIVLILYLFVLLFTVYIAMIYLFNDPANTPLVKGKLNNANFSLATWNVFFYTHIVLGLVSLALGPFQLTKRSRRNPKIHRRLGKVYAGAIFINIVMVPYIAMYATGGGASTVAFLVLDAAWLITTGMGVWRIYQRNIQAHRAWIMRSYAVTWAFVTFRIVVVLISLLFHASANVSFPLAVYISIVGNLLLTEVYLRRKRKNAVTKTNVIA